MLAIGTVEPQEFENTIICEEVKAVHPKVKVAKKTVSKKTKPVEDVVAVIEEVIKTIEEEEVKPVEEVIQPSTCDILEYLQRIENHLKKIDDFYSKLEIPHIECDITNEIKNTNERLNKIENLQIEEVEIVEVVDVVDIVEEVEIVEVVDVVDIVEEVEIVEVVEEVEIVEVVEEVEIIEVVEEVEMVNKKVNHKEIPNTNWLEYIPDDESYSTLILTYVKDNLNIDKRIMEFLKVRYIYINNKCRFQIFASDNITDNPVISFYQCNTKQEHFKSDANAFSIHLDSCIEFRADFLKKKKYNNFFSRRHSHKIVKRENEGAEIFFKIEQEIIKYSLGAQNILEEKKKDDCDTIVVKQQPQKKNYMKILPTEILDIIYEYARDDTHKKNFIKSYPTCFTFIENKKVKNGKDILECIQQNDDGLFQIFYKNRDMKKYPNSDILKYFVLPHSFYNYHSTFMRPQKRIIEITQYKTDITNIVSYIKKFEDRYNSDLTVKVFWDTIYHNIEIYGFSRTKKGIPSKKAVHVDNWGELHLFETKTEEYDVFRHIDELKLEMKKIRSEFCCGVLMR
jgi:hypothetical protein